MPPCCAMAMAVADSVTVSIAAESSGMFRRRLRVRRVPSSTSLGRTVLSAGWSSTSSNVSARRRGSVSICFYTLTPGQTPSRVGVTPVFPLSCRGLVRVLLVELAGGLPEHGAGGRLPILLAQLLAHLPGEGNLPPASDGRPDQDGAKKHADRDELVLLHQLDDLLQVPSEPVPEQHEQRRREQRGEAVEADEPWVRHAGRAGGEVGHRADAGHEACADDDLLPVPREEPLHQDAPGR